MTTVITRLYANEDIARGAENRLRWEGFPRNAVQVIAAAPGQGHDALTARMTHAMVDEGTAPAYADKVGGGMALLVVRATYRPLGAVRIARETLEKTDAVEAGIQPDEVYVRDGPDHAPSVLKDHPRFLTLPFHDDDVRPGPITERLGWRLLSKRPRRLKVISGDRRMSRMFWPQRLVTQNRKATSAMSGTRHMSQWFWPMPLIVSRPRRKSVIRGGGHPLSRLLGWPTIGR